MNIIGLISFSVFLVLLLALSYATIKFGMQTKKLTAENAQLKIDKIVLIDKIEKLFNEKESQSIEQTDGFLKFLSESRDWAFEYIEKVQVSIQSLKDAVQSGYDTEEAMGQLFSFIPEQQGENNEQGND